MRSLREDIGCKHRPREPGEDDDLCVRRDSSYLWESIETALPRHGEVEQDHVGLESLGLNNRLLTILSFTDHAETRPPRHDHGEQPPHGFDVVTDQDAG